MVMYYFYHGVPDDFRGSSLIPLNEMMKVDPELRFKYLEKYKGREEILERKIPLLDCFFNDVVQLLPMDPKKLFELQLKLGLINEIPNYTYFQIDPRELDPKRTVIYFKTTPGEEHVTVKWLDDVDLKELQDIPVATTEYYRNLVGKNEPVFNYQFVPHVIYKGRINVDNSGKLALIPSFDN